MSLAELDAAFADFAWPDRTPLNEAERADLRVRLDAPGGAGLELSLREGEARWTMGIIRSPEAVAELHDQVQAERHELRVSETSRAFAAGIVDALEWATGQTRQAPISGTLAEERPPAVRELSREQVVAQDVAEGRRRFNRSGGRDYAVGVEHTVMWLLARTDQRPWASPDR
jgi:hypothetical protein